MIIFAVGSTGVALLLYLGFGVAVDTIEKTRRREAEKAMDVLSRALYADKDALGPMLVELRSISNRVLFGLALTIPLHFDDLLSTRLLEIIGATTARQKIRRMSRSRFWHRRVRAARLSLILPDAEDVTNRLLSDSSAPVRAAVIESFGVDRIAQNAQQLLVALQDRNKSVRFTAQQALLRGDGRLVVPVAEALPSLDEDSVVRCLEVAANLRDPRLLPLIRQHGDSTNPRARRLVAHAAPFGVPDHQLYFLVAMLDDDDPGVRIAVIEAISRLRADWLANHLGDALGDPSWEVRRAAGSALSQLGTIGLLVLRQTLRGSDPFAHDMARQVLDAMAIDGVVRREDQLVVDGELDLLADWAAA